MKKLLSFTIAALVCLAFNYTAQAQIVKTITPTKTSLSATDTAYAVLPVDGTVRSVECGVTKTSGTVAGKVYLSGKTLDGATYVRLDSLTLANSAGLQYKLITMPTTLIYQAYRFEFISTGGVTVPTAYILRRN